MLTEKIRCYENVIYSYQELLIYSFFNLTVSQKNHFFKVLRTLKWLPTQVLTSVNIALL